MKIIELLLSRGAIPLDRIVLLFFRKEDL